MQLNAHTSAHTWNTGDGQKKSLIWLKSSSIKKTSNRVADFKIICIYYFIGLVVKIVLSEAVTRGVLYKKVHLKFEKFTGKCKCQSHFFNEFAGATMFLLIVLTWKPLNIVYRKLMKFFKVLPKKDPKNACKR